MRPGSMSTRAERTSSTRGAIRAAAAPRSGEDTPKKKPELKKVMPEVWKLVRPRRWLLLAGLILVAINRVAGLVLPYVSKPFIDQVLHHHHRELLWKLV